MTPASAASDVVRSSRVLLRQSSDRRLNSPILPSLVVAPLICSPGADRHGYGNGEASDETVEHLGPAHFQLHNRDRATSMSSHARIAVP